MSGTDQSANLGKYLHPRKGSKREPKGMPTPSPQAAPGPKPTSGPMPKKGK